ncbi:MAG: hypothetical protein RR920_08805 [Lachnospiraceae bacterium]
MQKVIIKEIKDHVGIEEIVLTGYPVQTDNIPIVIVRITKT